MRLILGTFFQVVISFLSLFVLLKYFLPANYYVDLLSHFSVIYLILAILSLVFILAAKNKKWVIPGCFLVIYFSLSLWPYFSDQPELSTGMACTQLGIFQVNLDESTPDPEQFMDALERLQPQLVYLSGVTPDSDQSLKQFKKDYKHVVSRPSRGQAGDLLLSKFPLRNIDKLKSNFVLSVDLMLADDFVLKFFGLSLPTPADISYSQSRDQEVKLVSRWARNSSRPVIVAGELNTTTFAHSYEPLSRFTSLTNASYGRGLVSTWPYSLASGSLTKYLALPLAQTLVHRSLVVTEHKVVDQKLSDHMGLFTKVEIPCDLY